jgi:hypothetical protein
MIKFEAAVKNWSEQQLQKHRQSLYAPEAEREPLYSIQVIRRPKSAPPLRRVHTPRRVRSRGRARVRSRPQLLDLWPYLKDGQLSATSESQRDHVTKFPPGRLGITERPLSGLLRSIPETEENVTSESNGDANNDNERTEDAIRPSTARRVHSLVTSIKRMCQWARPLRRRSKKD